MRSEVTYKSRFAGCSESQAADVAHHGVPHLVRG
jgi:hypothetical protein